MQKYSGLYVKNSYYKPKMVEGMFEWYFSVMCWNLICHSSTTAFRVFDKYVCMKKQHIPLSPSDIYIVTTTYLSLFILHNLSLSYREKPFLFFLIIITTQNFRIIHIYIIFHNYTNKTFYYLVY
jgi:hypothetical protein